MGLTFLQVSTNMSKKKVVPAKSNLMRDLGCKIDFPVKQKAEGGFYQSSPYCHSQNMND